MKIKNNKNGDWGLGIGDWGLGKYIFLYNKNIIKIIV